MNDDEPNICESVRFWRLNSIEALKMMKRSECEAQDPEHLASIKANNAELAGLQAKESAVKARHARIYNRNNTP